MLIIPMDRKVDWSNAPVVTIALVLLNILLFFTWQSGEDRHLEAAIDYYFQSGLAEIEIPRYIDLIEARGEDTGELREAAAEGPNAGVFFRMLYDNEYLHALESGRLIAPDDPRHAEWTSLRSWFEEKLARVTFYEYGLMPGDVDAADLLAHMFLHGSIDHLVGNMIFLFAVGFIVEAVLGRALYLVSYLLAGFGSAALHIVVNADSLVPSIGASGAIAGLMGMYAVLFGLRRVRFFYFLFVYFDYVKAPAILLLVLWLGYEVFQQLSYADVSNINYIAHIGGFLSGGLIAAVLKLRKGLVNEDYLDERPGEDERDDRLERAEGYKRDLDFDRAASLFKALLLEQPENRELLCKLYDCVKFNPGSDDYHATALRIFALTQNDVSTDRLVLDTYREYLQKARPKPKLSRDIIEQLAQRFLRQGEIQESETLVRIMLRNRHVFTESPSYLLRLARLYRQSRQARKAREYLLLLRSDFPDTHEAQVATQLLD